MRPERILRFSSPFVLIALFIVMARCSENPVSSNGNLGGSAPDLVWTEESLPEQVTLAGVTGGSSTDVYAVGRDGTLLHYDGTGWSTLLEGSPEFTLSAAWGSSATCVYTVGENHLSGTGMILKYTAGASSWYFNGCGTGYCQRGIWGKADNEVYALADFGYIQRCTNGASFMVTDHLDEVEHLFDIWLSSQNNMVVVGDEGLWHKTKNRGWTRVDTGEASAFKGVWGNGPEDIFAVGSGGAVMHWNGFSWFSMESGTSETLNDVWGCSGYEVYAAGNSGTLIFYNGTEWKKIDTGREEAFFKLWGSSAGNIYLAGASILLHGTAAE